MRKRVGRHLREGTKKLRCPTFERPPLTPPQTLEEQTSCLEEDEENEWHVEAKCHNLVTKERMIQILIYKCSSMCAQLDPSCLW